MRNTVMMRKTPVIVDLASKSMTLSTKRTLATSSAQRASFKLLVVGGGAGGCSTAAKFASKLGPGQVGIIEPNETHYYQPLWTLVGGGLKNVADSGRPMKQVLPKEAVWIKDKAASFDPDNNKVVTKNGEEVFYEHMVIAMGLDLHYNKVKGLHDALATPYVGSNYSPKYVIKTAQGLENFKGGKALFTFPNSPVKCAGAPQKIMYIFESALRNRGIRDKATIEYFTSLGVIFGVKKYADSLWDIVKERDINVFLRRNLIEVRPDTREAVFENLDKPDEAPLVRNYDFLHVTPPMGPPEALKSSSKLVDQAGFLDVNMTLQHKKYPNIFGIGDCTNVPCAKTAAAVASQLGTMRKNLGAALKGEKTLPSQAEGYTSCPLVVSAYPGKVVLAEFDASSPPQPLETFPVNQAKASRFFYLFKSEIFPRCYWMMLKGFWEGPRMFRKIFHLGMSK